MLGVFEGCQKAGAEGWLNPKLPVGKQITAPALVSPGLVEPALRQIWLDVHKNMSWEAREEQEMHPPRLKAVSPAEELHQGSAVSCSLLAQRRLTSPLARAGCGKSQPHLLLFCGDGLESVTWTNTYSTPLFWNLCAVSITRATVFGGQTWASQWHLLSVAVKRSRDIAVPVCTILLLGCRWKEVVLKPHKEQEAACTPSYLHCLASWRTQATLCGSA